MTNKLIAAITGKDMMYFETPQAAELYSAIKHQVEIDLSAEKLNIARGFFNAFVFSLLFWTALILSIIYL